MTAPTPTGGGPLRLRRPVAADAPVLARLGTPEVAGEFNWFDDPPEEQLGSAGPQVAWLIVTLNEGTPIGDVSWFSVPYGPNRRSLAWRIGITLLPEHRGCGYGALAQSVLADHLFATTVGNRVEATTDVANVAEQGALERAGFTREGVLGGAQYRQGQWHDLLLYAKVRATA